MGWRWTGIKVCGALLLSGACAEAQNAGPAAAPAAVSLPVPVMAGTLSLSQSPPTVNVGPFGTWYVDGAFSALGLAQTRPDAGDRAVLADVSNGQLFVQKTDGLLRFYVQLGAYALPVLGQAYAHATDARSTPGRFFDAVPQAFIKIAPSDSFSVQAGKLPTLIGNEYSFTFENVNIERGLLWNQEPAVSRGVQANYVAGPLGFSVSVNDGFYANRYTWLSGSATWTVNPPNVLVFAAGANLGASSRNDAATPVDQNNGSIYNIIYTYTKGPLMVSPYLQYSTVPTRARIGIRNGASMYGGAVLASYAFTSAVSLGVRLEYETSTGAPGSRDTANLLYGPGSSAASVTVTPTYTHGRWFVRGDLSALSIQHGTRGDSLGSTGDSQAQLRSLLEVGYLF